MKTLKLTVEIKDDDKPELGFCVFSILLSRGTGGRPHPILTAHVAKKYAEEIKRRIERE